MSPPLADQQGHGQSDPDGFAEQAGGEQRQRQTIARVLSRWVRFIQKTQPRASGGQIEQRREQVLASYHPRDGFHVYRMHREQRGGQPSAGHGQPQQDPPEQQHVGEMQQHVDGMKAGRDESPQPVIQPEGGVGQRPVVSLALDLAWRKPDVPEAGGLTHRRSLGKRPVVPHETAQHRRVVADRHQQSEPQPQEDHGSPTRERAFLIRANRDRGRRPGSVPRFALRRQGSRGKRCPSAARLACLHSVPTGHVATQRGTAVLGVATGPPATGETAFNCTHSHAACQRPPALRPARWQTFCTVPKIRPKAHAAPLRCLANAPLASH